MVSLSGLKDIKPLKMEIFGNSAEISSVDVIQCISKNWIILLLERKLLWSQNQEINNRNTQKQIIYHINMLKMKNVYFFKNYLEI